MKPIAFIKTDFKEKFGIPRQSGLVPHTKGMIEFLPEYRQPEAFHGLEDFSHIWILWEFSEAKRSNWSATVKPPKLGGKTKMGVFATRSPFRPNPIGLSCVKLEKIEYTASCGPIILVSGVDMLDGTPIYDIKPYLPYADSYPDAKAGFTENIITQQVSLLIPDDIRNQIPADILLAIKEIILADPRPGIQKNYKTDYSIQYSKYDIHFKYLKNEIHITSIDLLK